MNKEMINQLVSVGKNFYNRGWLYATSGNLSVRTDEGIILTAAGSHKGYLTDDDFVLIDIEGNVLDGKGKPSGETDFHLQLYKNFSTVNAVVHTHSVYSCLLSNRGYNVIFQNNELMKAFDGVKEPSEPIEVPIFPNIQKKAEVLELILSNIERVKYGYLLQGHGLFSFASSLEKVQIYTEAFEFLFKYEFLK